MMKKFQNSLSFSFSLVRSCWLIGLFVSVAMGSNEAKIFNVLDYGAIGDGQTDSTKAIQNAWDEACAFIGTPGVLIPQGTFLVGPLMFKGTCKSPMVFQLKGALLASSDLSVYESNWVAFQYIDQLLITGGGKFDGQGALAWPCKKNGNCKMLPWSINFSFVTNAIVEDIISVDSKGVHMQIYSCNNLNFTSVHISAPRDSPNTDGMHIGQSSNIEISNSVIGTGDDCVSIGPGTKHVTVSNVFCGPGHGISIGSLGGGPNEEEVSDLTVTNCTLTETDNGLRIKTWQGSPTESSASGITFNDIVMINVAHPIIIDQNYCPTKNCDGQSPSKVQISNVKYQNIRGESRKSGAIDFSCSAAYPCQDIELSDVNLQYTKNGRVGKTTMSCNNVQGKSYGLVIPPSCI